MAPGGPIAIVRMAEGQRRFALVRWGFVPSWTKEIKPGKPLINARGETVADKPSFRNAFRRRRCLIPADGFYEWQGDVPGKKRPFLFRRPDQGLFAFAGLWEHWAGPDGSELETGLIITTSPNRVAAPIHDRMPAIIAPADYETWLTGETEAARSPSATKMMTFCWARDGSVPARTAINAQTIDLPMALPPVFRKVYSLSVTVGRWRRN